jgi:SnoaL-like domain
MRAEENAEKLRAFWEAWTPGGEMDMSILDPDVIYEDSNLPDHIGEEYRGHEGIARATERWLEPYESLTIELERIVGSGDRFVSIHRGRSKARYTGIEEELVPGPRRGARSAPGIGAVRDRVEVAGREALVPERMQQARVLAEDGAGHLAAHRDHLVAMI